MEVIGVQTVDPKVIDVINELGLGRIKLQADFDQANKALRETPETVPAVRQALIRSLQEMMDSTDARLVAIITAHRSELIQEGYHSFATMFLKFRYKDESLYMQLNTAHLHFRDGAHANPGSIRIKS